MAQGRSTNIISMTEWIRTSRLSIKNSLSPPPLLPSPGPREPQRTFRKREWCVDRTLELLSLSLSLFPPLSLSLSHSLAQSLSLVPSLSLSLAPPAPGRSRAHAGHPRTTQGPSWGYSKVNLQQICQFLTTISRKMAPRTRKRLQERGQDNPTKGLLWISHGTTREGISHGT